MPFDTYFLPVSMLIIDVWWCLIYYADNSHFVFWFAYAWYLLLIYFQIYIIIYATSYFDMLCRLFRRDMLMTFIDDMLRLLLFLRCLLMMSRYHWDATFKSLKYSFFFFFFCMFFITNIITPPFFFFFFSLFHHWCRFFFRYFSMIIDTRGFRHTLRDA